jgi:ABC-type uncharacterized transport system substrate-binding protein
MQVIAGGLLAAPHAAEAQPAGKIPRIGVLSPGNSARAASNPRMQSFYQALRDLGWVEGQNVAFERRYAEDQIDRLPDLANELARLNVDVIVTASTPPAKAARAATSTIPIVMMDPGDPVASGLVASLARPGGNVTGIAPSPRTWLPNAWRCSRGPFPRSPAWRSSSMRPFLLRKWR